jgi:hypothetical protein
VRVDSRGGGGSNNGRVGLLGLLLLILFALLPKEAISGLVDNPPHMRRTPMISVLSHFLLFLFVLCWGFFLPHLLANAPVDEWIGRWNIDIKELSVFKLLL